MVENMNAFLKFTFWTETHLVVSEGTYGMIRQGLCSVKEAHLGWGHTQT